MARRTQVLLVDDVDGTPAEETVTFAVDRVTYQIDLAAKNAQSLRAGLAPWVGAARKPSAQAAGKHRRIAAVGESRNALIRAWTGKHSITVPARGRVPADVRRQYEAAN